MGRECKKGIQIRTTRGEDAAKSAGMFDVTLNHGRITTRFENADLAASAEADVAASCRWRIVAVDGEGAGAPQWNSAGDGAR